MARWLAARSGHGDFATYHERFNHASAEMLCRCGARKAPLHFSSCRKAPARHRLKFFKERPMTLEDFNYYGTRRRVYGGMVKGNQVLFCPHGTRFHGLISIEGPPTGGPCVCRTAS